MPSLPELGNTFADKRIFKVFIKMKTENSAQSYSNIRIAGKVKIIPERNKNRSVPCSENRKCLYSLIAVIRRTEAVTTLLRLLAIITFFPIPRMILLKPSDRSLAVVFLLSIS